jgi:hypothetical protein
MKTAGTEITIGGRTCRSIGQKSNLSQTVCFTPIYL